MGATFPCESNDAITGIGVGVVVSMLTSFIKV